MDNPCGLVLLRKNIPSGHSFLLKNAIAPILVRMAKLFLGLDSSTQSLSAVVIDLDTRKVIYEKSLNFDKALPHYKTRNGVLPNRNPLVNHSPPLMWAEALDLIFAQMKNDGVALDQILAVSGSGQQHGSVYFNGRITAALENLDAKKLWRKI